MDNTKFLLPDHEATIPVWIHRLAALHGDRPLITLGKQRISYNDAERQSARLARGLLAAGVRKSTHVGVLMPNGPDWVLAWLAATRIGAVAVPLSTYLRPRELVVMLARSDVEVLLTWATLGGQDYLDGLEQCVRQLVETVPGSMELSALPRLKAVYAWGGATKAWANGGYAELVALADAQPHCDAAYLESIEQAVEAEDPMLIMFSSGSTGEPKGAVHSHRGIIQHTFNVASFRDLAVDDRVYSPMPFCWVGGFAANLLPIMHSGASIVCQEAFDPGEALDLIERERISIAFGLPPHGKAMASHPAFAGCDRSSLRGGNLFDILPDAVKPADPGLRAQSLGMTETAGPHTLDLDGHELAEAQRGTVGKAMPGVEHKLIDPDTGAICPPGTEGEICVRGYNLMQGLYQVDPADTFDADGYYHTGDLGVFDTDGYLFFRGRLGEIIRSGGTNVVPRDVEAALVECAGVSEAFVVGVPDAELGTVVGAAIVLEPGASLTADELRKELKNLLSAYKLPRRFAFVAKQDLPLTRTGKVHKQRLRERLQAGHTPKS